ncbi:glucose 1-dehydrogenase [Pediococcus acidilactici]|uniref:glucose 1-dehydrogenase n=1 Tax=Pediococcus acidilactici TaxID=1254 RepID=UPI00132195ED|nr:glucose 1-dehydrogenase [Pediococcus acidilactici]KAF0363806.1 glucose 1-dehydrogenase [Pediococcus acidilactici]KAF0367562.1 glucose 1-dehydrogenase [Pediococcus acidilactici]KAF0418340.1 glucose 1-dehydrogenase [Pediococcus acidilactici]KAF0421331.1 glucose 1-dehydrogenase [Pediococcus acidilactici]KAF0474064.1 glucose 1-dehydrogenase [Pediococcus acidilactici]
MSRLDGKVAIITGGVKGFGLACAKLFVREGAKVVITDVDVAGASEALQEIGEDKAVFVKQDVAVEDYWEPVFRTAIDKFEKVGILVNNAGILAFDNAENIELDEWHKILSVNLDGIMLGVKYGIRHMKEKGGSIINMASIAGLIGIYNLYAYNASKGGVRLLTKSAALYCAEKHYPIRINSVHPGYAHTPMVDAYPEMRADLEKLHPVGRLGTAEEIANMVLYLASDESSFSTGSEFVVDGGYTAQ